MARRFEWRPAQSAAVLAQLNAAPSGPVVVDGAALAQGFVGALVGAELLAADAGVIPYVSFFDDAGVEHRGVASIGGARDVIDDPAKWKGGAGAVQRASDFDPRAVRALYLATHGAVRQAHASTRDAPASSPTMIGPLGGVSEIGFLPVGVYLVAVGVAAIVAGAAYAIATENKRIEVAGDNARQAARLDLTNKLANVELQTTGRISPAVWASLAHEADAEAKKASLLGNVPIGVWAGGAALGLGLGAWYLTRDEGRGRRALLAR